MNKITNYTCPICGNIVDHVHQEWNDTLRVFELFFECNVCPIIQVTISIQGEDNIPQPSHQRLRYLDLE